MDIAVIGNGPEFSLYGLIIDGICQISVYLRDIDEVNLKQFAVLVNEILHHGPPKNKEKFRPLGDDIFELKTRNGMRIGCFFGGINLPKSLILTHGFSKCTSKKLQREKNKALKWLEEYLQIKDIRKHIKFLEVEP
jgi:phage-related protein